MATTTAVDSCGERPPVVDMDQEQSRRFFDTKACTLLGIGGEEFLRRWQAGEYAAIADDSAYPDNMYLALLGTGGRYDASGGDRRLARVVAAGRRLPLPRRARAGATRS